jgi:hypothetical protein
MGFVTKTISGIVGGLTGSTAAKAANQAASTQAASADKAIDFQKEALDKVLANLKPFKDAGQSALPGLTSLVTDPNAQKDYVLNNPLFNAMADKSKNDLFANQAAKGKVGSGGTAAALQDRLLQIGTDLVNNGINNRQNLVSMGENAAAGSGSAIQSTGNNVSNLLTQQGNAQAAGLVGAANAKTAATQNLVNTGMLAYALCDITLKENIKRVGYLKNGLPVYEFNYKGSKKREVNVIAQDVEKVMPEAVMNIHGIKLVNMEMVCR